MTAHAALLLCPLLLAGVREKPARPNVVLIVADDLGYGDLGCQGSREIRTPHLDGLARQGVRLTDFYASACVCSPTRASLLTGRYPQRDRFEWVIDYHEKTRGLPASATDLPALLGKAGYSTGLFGKWHLGYKDEFAPNAHGFDEFFGFLAADLDYYSHKDANGDPGLYENTRLVKRKGYLTDLITERSLSFIDRHARRPFFLQVSFNAPHWPFQPPGKPGDVRDAKSYGPETGTRADYVRMVEHLDASVGKLLARLRDRKLDGNTLVVFLSDNGGERLSDMGPLFHGKYSLWEGGIRVPCIARLPGTLPAGKTSAVPVIAMDWHRTILALAGVSPPAKHRADGLDILAALAGKKALPERALFWRLLRPGEKFGQKAVRRGKWKLIQDRGVELLFDLEADAGERKNLAYRKPAVVAGLAKALAAWEATLPRP
jgi:arylsulfatase A-like enzyme